jgi:hypothetical protein
MQAGFSYSLVANTLANEKAPINGAFSVRLVTNALSSDLLT